MRRLLSLRRCLWPGLSALVALLLLTGCASPAGQGSSEAPPLNVPFLAVAFLVQYPLMLGFPLLLGWWIRRRYEIGWGVFGAGALTFIASQVVHLPLNWALGLLTGGRGVALWPLVPMALVAGLSAGVCEEVARWIALRFFMKKTRGWQAALQFGAGHGGAEAIIFGVLAMTSMISMIAMRSVDPASLNVPAETAEQVRKAVTDYWATPWYMSALAGLERVMAIIFHIAMAVLVMRAVTRNQPAYLVAAIAAHAGMDFAAVWAVRTLGAEPTEGVVAILALAALGLTIWLREPRQPQPEPEQAMAAPVPTAAALTPRDLTPEELARRADASRYE